ncbi:hypothetical protein C7999DRAFT_13228 [Corynascus novoguineensis]|uniref:non-specific serine/threonine protein kinase n=1 Tax=Corynascus novoguineensis TaxID=1126955 RepID=A0AAN7CVN6_9PEZI|nr:hypothetical protein C7999DRAFT_13228 [Corynascus novoguineensis]
MDHGTHRRSASRQPLGDATQRLNHVTVTHVNRSYEIGDVENHISYAPQSAPGGHSNLVPILKRFPSENDHYHTLDTTTLVGSGQATACSALLNPGTQNPSDVRRVSQISNVSSNASSMRQLKTHIGPWQLGKTLGKGSSARVRLARHRVTHQLVAIKIVAKSTAHITQAGSLANLDSIDYRKSTTSANDGIRRMPLAIEREVAILKLIRHPNIIELQDIWENRSEIYLVTEYVEKGDLFEFINWNGPLQEEEAIFYFRQIMAALDYCHSFNICHRDLKPENILLKANGQIKIADFGMAALQQNPSHQLRTACGSPHYAAPELLRHQVYKGSAVDIWSMGVILYAMLAGRLPFDDHDLEIMMMKAKRAEYKMPPHLSREAKDLIRRILVDQPTHRITMKQMWRHALITMYEYLEEYQKWDGKSPNTLRNMSNIPAPKEIDTQILRQLRALWHRYSESALQEKLRQEKPNDQKLFYWLLYDHREAQLENYNNNLPISNSDFHHLKPPNWGKRISTCQFTKPARNGQTRTLSKFTVISNVPDVDEVGTVRSYDPYNASRILKPCGSQVSHAKIIVHRNNPEPGVEPSPTTVSHSYRSYQSVKGSFYQRAGTNPRRTSTAGQLRSPKTSMGSIHNQQSNPCVRVSNKSRRSVDFSSIRNKGHHHRRNRHADSATCQDSLLPACHTKKSDAHKVAATGSMMNVGDTTEDPFNWSEELEQLVHCITRDCDEAFRTSLPISETNYIRADSHETNPFLLSLGSLHSVQKRAMSSVEPCIWDNRLPSPASSKDTAPPPSIRPNNDLTSLTAKSTEPRLNVPIAERRIVSEPVYDRPSRDARPLPSVYENTPDNWMRQNGSRHKIATTSLKTPTHAKNKGLDFWPRAENTIRMVNSPSAIGAEHPVEIPKPLNIRKISHNVKNARPRVAPLLHDWQRHLSCGSQQNGQSMNDSGLDTIIPRRRVSSWFRRAAKLNASESTIETVVDSSALSKETLVDSELSNFNGPNSQITENLPLFRPQKKKSFGLALWKGVKHEMKNSFAGSDPDDIQVRDEKKTRKRSSKEPRMLSSTAHDVWSESDGCIRKIEVQQNWLARLFRVKPAVRYLCFNILRRRARQEIAILLREWRKYDLDLKEVSFAIELMAVIEHGKRNQLTIARFTQEEGAASSFHRVVDGINAAFGTRALLIMDKRKIRMMIETINF